MKVKIQLLPINPQTIHHHRNRTKSHSAGGDSRRQESEGGQRDSDGIIEEGPEEIFITANSRCHNSLCAIYNRHMKMMIYIKYYHLRSTS